MLSTGRPSGAASRRRLSDITRLGLLLLLLGFSAEAQARSLTEILLEKGVLTPEEAARVEKPGTKATPEEQQRLLLEILVEKGVLTGAEKSEAESAARASAPAPAPAAPLAKTPPPAVVAAPPPAKAPAPAPAAPPHAVATAPAQPAAPLGKPAPPEKDEPAGKEEKQLLPFAKVQYEEGSGITITSNDDRFQLSTGIWGQLRYQLTDVDGQYTDPTDGTEDSQTVEIPRIRAYWKGFAFSPRLEYDIELEMNGSAGDLLRNAYGEYALIDEGWLTFRGGQWKTPFCRQEMTSDSKQEFNERSLACQNFRFERARGLQLYGLPMDSLFEYYAGVFNETGRNGPANPDLNFLYVFRLATNPLGAVGYSESDVQDTPSPLFGIGTSYAYEKARADVFTTAAVAETDPDDPSQVTLVPGQFKNRVPFLRMIQPFYDELANPGALTADIHNLEADFAFRWRGLFLEAEYFHAWISNDAHAGAAPGPPFQLPPSSFQARGWYAQGGYFVIPKHLELAIRYSSITPNLDFDVTLADGSTIVPDQTELLGAINYYFYAHNLKIMTDFGPISSEAVENASGAITQQDDFRWRIQAQLYF